MDEFKRYLGLAAALAVLALAFFPTGGDADYPDAEKLTPLSGSVLSLVMTRVHDGQRFHAQATSHLNTCQRVKGSWQRDGTARESAALETVGCPDGSHRLLQLVQGWQDKLTAHEPELPALASEFGQRMEAESRMQDAHRVSLR